MQKLTQDDIRYFGIDALHLDFNDSNFWLLKTSLIPKIESTLWEIYIEEILNRKKTYFYKEYFMKMSYKWVKQIVGCIRFWFDKVKKKEANVVEIYWNLFRLANFEEINFWINDILDFIKNNFFDTIIRKLEIAVDFETENINLLKEIHEDLIKKQEIENKKKAKWKEKNNIGFYMKWPKFESVNIWDNGDDNKSYYYKMYDKKLEILSNSNDDKLLYLNYFNIDNNIIRFETSLRKHVINDFNYEELYFVNNKNSTLFNILITSFIWKEVDIFDLKYEKVLVKDLRNQVNGSLEVKIDKTKNQKIIKSISSSLKKIENETWEDRLYILKNIDPIINNLENLDEYIMLYEQLFETIFLYYERWNIDELKYNDIAEIINWWLEYTSNFLWLSVDEFLRKIKWYVNNNIWLMFSLFDERIVKIIHLYYFSKKKFKNDNLFNFLKIVDESNIRKFNVFFNKEYNQEYISNLEKKVKFLWNEKNIEVANLFSIILK